MHNYQGVDRFRNLKFSILALALFLWALPSSAIAQVLFSEDWEGGTLDPVKWISFGSPSPQVVDGAGNPGYAFDNNGDPNYNNGILSQQTFDISNGITIEGDMYVPSNPNGCWIGGSIGLSASSTDYGDTTWPAYAAGIYYEYSGSLCWADPDPKDEGILRLRVRKDDGTLEYQQYELHNDYLDAWHKYKIQINPDRTVSFYVDNNHIWTSSSQVSLNYNNMPILLGLRSSSYGKTYHDNIVVSDFLSVDYSGADFTISDGTGAVTSSGSVSSITSPYWPDANYNIRDYAVGNVDDDPEEEIIFIANHSPYYPGQVYVVNADGTEVGRYWNPGHITSLILHDINGDGVEEILLGATNNDKLANGTNVPTIFALDARTMAGEAPPRAGSVGTGTELWYAFPDLTVNAGINLLTVSGGRITGNTQADGSGTDYVLDLTDGSAYIVTGNFDFESTDLSGWSLSGNGDWSVTSTKAHGGASAAEAPISIGDGQSATMEKTVDCADGDVTFWYSVSSESGWDYLNFYIDGARQGRWSGSIDWTQASFPVSAGTHTFTWVYSKDGSVSSGSDTAWIDDVVLPLDSDVDGVLDTVDNCPDIANPTQSDIDGDGIGDSCDPSTSDGNFNFESGDLGGWTLTGNGDWSVTGTKAHTGSLAAEAPVSIGDGQSATMEKTIDCAEGDITFWYSVSSEGYYDYLWFYIDDIVQDRWSGSIDWTQASFPVTAGTHTLKWVYSKDGSVSSGSDTAWVDDVLIPGTFVDSGGSDGWRYGAGDLGGTGYIELNLAPQSGAPGVVWEQTLVNDATYARTGDVDRDGLMDLVVVNGTDLHIYYGDVNKQDPVVSMPAQGISPILEDVTGDGALEIIVGSRNTENNQVNIYEGSGTLLHTIVGPAGVPSDSQYSKMEPITYLGNDILAVILDAGYSLDPRGYAAYNIQTGTEVWFYDVGPRLSMPVAADVDNDGLAEMVASVFTPHNGASGNGTSDGDLYTILLDENGVNEFTSILGADTSGGANGYGQHLLTDLEGDGSYEIIATVGHYSSYPGDAQIRILSPGDGSVLYSYSSGNNARTSIKVADLNGDGIKEIIASNIYTGDIFVLDNHLNLLRSHSAIGVVSSIGDINGDHSPEILAQWGNVLKALDQDTLSERWSIDLGSTVRGGFPSDTDNDGYAEVVVIQEGKISIVAPMSIFDIDNDGVEDSVDAFPNDVAASIDSDGDGAPDAWNSGYSEADSTTGLVLDAFPSDATETLDSDGDGVGDNADAFPNDSTETVDSDGDGVGDNADVFPTDSSEWLDSDGDGIGDNADAFPNDVAASVDSDGDGAPDAWNSGYTQADSTTGLVLDAFPADSSEWVDTDSDGLGDNSDPSPNGGPNDLTLRLNQVDTSLCPTISGVVTVSDQDGNPITGLSVTDFTVYEDGAGQSPISVVAAGGNAAVSVSLALDYSGSMDSAALSAMETAAQEFISQMNAIDSGEVIKFSTAVEVVQGYTTDQTALSSAVSASWAGAGQNTALYDAIAQGVNDATTRSGRKAVIVLTDGIDGVSSQSLQGAIDLAVQAGVPVFTIGLGSADATVLQQIASDTGGQYYDAPTSSDLQAIYQSIGDYLANQYVVEYTTTARDGLAHNLEIAATSGSLSGSDTVSFTSCGQLNVSLSQVQSDSCPNNTAVVTVTDGTGTPVTGLGTGDFTLREDGVPVTLGQVDTAANSGGALSVALTLDYSGSMDSSALSAMEAAAQDFIIQMGSGDAGEIIKFSSAVEVVQGYTTDTTALSSSVSTSWAGSGGSTAFYDAVHQGVADTLGRSGRRAILAMTDGSDNVSTHSLQQVIDYANQNGVPVFTVGLGSANSSVLQQMAADTGGQYYYAPTAADLQTIYQAVSSALANQYMLSYSTAATDSAYHTLEVEVTSGGLTGRSSRQIGGCDPTGTLAGTVIDSQSGDPISGASVTVSGTTNQRVQTDSSGNYRIDLPEGSYTVSVQTSGYIDPNSQTADVTSATTTTVNFAMAAITQTQAYRMVLTWGANPTDLDSHLWVPSSGSCGHVWYSSMGSATSFPYAQLDVDDTTSYGPETVSIEQLQSGGYQYWVHNFSGSPDLTTSAAQVALYDGSTLLQTFTIPTSPTGNDSWHVFDIDGATGAVTVVDQLGSLSSGTCVQSTTTSDSDNDGVEDSVDAFPNDVAASVDSDGDGAPDVWNSGYTEADSTTGLVLDAFPNDASETLDSDGDGVGDNADATPYGDHISDGDVAPYGARDGAVNVGDAVVALRMAMGLVTTDADDLIHGDVAPLVNGAPAPDGSITVGDAVVILRKAMGLVSF